MARIKYAVGAVVAMRCPHLKDGEMVVEWLTGTVVQADHRMVAVRFDQPVFTAIGSAAPDNILWAAHGSPNLRPGAAQHNETND